MGAGSWGAGVGPAGEDPVADPTAPRRVEPLRAAFFDGATRTFPFDSSGRLRDVHPVDQEVALAILLELEKLGSSPETGSTLRKIPFLDGSALQAEADRRVRVALARPLAAKDIGSLQVTATRPQRGRVRIVVRWSNSRSDMSLRSVTVTLNG